VWLVTSYSAVTNRKEVTNLLSKDIKTLAQYRQDLKSQEVGIFLCSGVASWYGGRAFAKQFVNRAPRLSRFISTATIFGTLLVLFRVFID